ncbi:MAG: hypothetical protein JXX29_17805, partial [Deltaproteobacteria bacterium]|nr:hypothetical protein [Deltaproteobacteria bacterium]
TVLERNPAVKDAHKLYQQFTADQELMERYQARQKYLSDLATVKEVSHDGGYAEGKAEGLAEGEIKGRKESAFAVAKLMKQNGEPSIKIHQYTGLSTEEIEAIER